MVAFRRLSCVLAFAPLNVAPALAEGFTGVHAGVLVGHESGTGSSPVFDIDMAGGIAGLEVGATYQFDNGWVAGVSADVGRSYTTGALSRRRLPGVRGQRRAVGSSSRQGRPRRWQHPALRHGRRRLHAVHLLDELPAGAPKFSICNTLGEFSTSTGDARFGYAVGAGLEVALTENISMKAEYLHSNYGTREVTLNPPLIDPQTTDVSLSSSAVRTGLLFRF